MMGDLIKRQVAIDAIPQRIKGVGGESWMMTYRRSGYNDCVDACLDAIRHLPSAQPEPKWIPFKTRPLTEEEKEEYPEWDCILDCKLPDDGQAILVSINLRGHECVQYDEFYSDDGSYLDSGYAIGTEAVAWMPLPEPYQEGES